jgi:hypothetical protein
MMEALTAAVLTQKVPESTYICVADFSEVFDGDDMAFPNNLIKDIGVRATLPSPFIFEETPSYRGQAGAGSRFAKEMIHFRQAV